MIHFLIYSTDKIDAVLSIAGLLLTLIGVVTISIRSTLRWRFVGFVFAPLILAIAFPLQLILIGAMFDTYADTASLVTVDVISFALPLALAGALFYFDTRHRPRREETPT